MGKRIAVYPGSFDPITYGHVDLVRRGARIFDEIYVAISVNVGKAPLFTKEERLKLVQQSTRGIKNCRVVAYDGLVVDFCRKIGACAILRGIRTVTDFDYEFQIALTNRSFAPNIETVFVMPAEELSYISSSLVKEAVAMGGNVSNFVPPAVNKALIRKHSRSRNVTRDWR
jgi:pantetheine-phosphate adenylyltransferase